MLSIERHLVRGACLLNDELMGNGSWRGYAYILAFIHISLCCANLTFVDE